MVQAIGAVLRHEGVKNALGTVRDKATAAKIRASGGVGGPAEGQLAELDLACRKATSHEDIVPKEKHIITLKKACGASGGGFGTSDISHVVHKLQKRLHHGHGWRVTLKSLYTFHRMLRELDSSFQDELLAYTETTGHRRPLLLDAYIDTNTNATWDYSNWVRNYSVFLDARLASYRRLGIDVENYQAADLPGVLQSMPADELVAAAETLVAARSALLSAVPEGMAAKHPICVATAALVAREAAASASAMHEAILALIERASELSTSAAAAGLDLFRRASELYDAAGPHKAKLEAVPGLVSSAGGRLGAPPALSDEGLAVLRARAEAAPPSQVGRRRSSTQKMSLPLKSAAPASARVEIRAVSACEVPDLLTDLDDFKEPPAKPSPAAPSAATAAEQSTFGLDLLDEYITMDAPAPQTPAAAGLSIDPFFQAANLSSASPGAGESTPATFSSAGTPSTFSTMFSTPASSVTTSPPDIRSFSTAIGGDFLMSPTPNSAMTSPFGGNNPFGSPMRFDAPVKSAMSNAVAQAPPRTMPGFYGASAQPSPAVPPSSALAAAGLTTDSVASAMAKTSLADPFAELTGLQSPQKAAQRSSGSQAPMSAMRPIRGC